MNSKLLRNIKVWKFLIISNCWREIYLYLLNVEAPNSWGFFLFHWIINVWRIWKEKTHFIIYSWMETLIYYLWILTQIVFKASYTYKNETRTKIIKKTVNQSFNSKADLWGPEVFKCLNSFKFRQNRFINDCARKVFAWNCPEWYNLPWHFYEKILSS